MDQPAERPRFRLSPLSGATLHVIPYYDGYKLGPATGFFYRSDGDVYLVSNWHVLAGRNANTGQPLSRLSCVPNRLEIQFSYSQDGVAKFAHEFIEIGSDDDSLLIQHELGQDIDMAALKISRRGTPRLFSYKNLVHCINDDNFSDPATVAGSEIVVLGFPDGLAKQGPLPIWKRGMVATEVDVPIDGKPIFLIDCMTRAGMSGSPVLQYSAHGIVMDKNGSSTMHAGPVASLIGVYSGRYTTDEEHLSLGIVWKEDKLRELILNPSPYSYRIIRNSS